jgi:hypothetical protein
MALSLDCGFALFDAAVQKPSRRKLSLWFD